MIAGIIGSFFRGRYVCGNLCPRGSFLDRILAKVSPGKHIPDFFRGMPFRILIMVLLMGFMFFRGAADPTNVYHWGSVFWMMCLVTTGIAVILGTAIHQRSWCSFCPIGTMQNMIGGQKDQLAMAADSCKECKLCEKACPFDLAIVQYKDLKQIPNRDCLKCSECISACPRNSLSWSQA